MFLEEVERAAAASKELIRTRRVKVLSQFDADGITSAAILTKALVREDASFEVRILKQLTSDIIADLKPTEDDLLILSDFGSGQLDMLSEVIERTNVVILDHHEPRKFEHPNLIHVNPLLTGEAEMSASIVCYMFAKFLDHRNADLVDIAMIGAAADEADEKWEFKGFIKRVLDEGVAMGKISVVRGLRLYGRNTRPIYKSLAFTFDPFIPGISGSESQAIQFLSDLGIPVKNGTEWRTLKDLTMEEQQKMASAMIMERLRTEDDASDIFGDIHTLFGRPEELQDVREFGTLINACGRTGNHDIALRILLGDYSVMDRCWSVMEGYRATIAQGINWVRNNQKSIVSAPKATIIVARGSISEMVIGTVSTIVLSSGIIDPGKPVFGMAYTADGRIKVSGRVSKALKGINIKDIISAVAESLGGEGGGHVSAAGGLIPRDREADFIRIVGGVEEKGEMIGS
ncbi:MAG: DHH family phosphoesterase [Candidatus Aenigmarchaeota archaeon]|nr:DHH family phosphoesterase [Candidatus Aenigmarchaeota archaeon]